MLDTRGRSAAAGPSGEKTTRTERIPGSRC
jgi:hypothetical protein